ncbi:hypothetical protein VTI74DRAFT_1929 [Chaetomium olivicolor]
MSKQHAPGVTQADPSRPGLANLPYELQAAIFEAAAVPQVFFMQIANDTLTFSPPADKGLALACQLSREHFLRHKKRYRFGDAAYWVDPERDIFYLYKDDPIPRSGRPNTDIRIPGGDAFNPTIIRNVAVDLQYLGHHPRHDAIFRIWSIFPCLKQVHIFVPKAPLQTPALPATPETLVLSELPSTQVVAAPGHDRELWLAVRYQVKKVCGRILDADNGWHGRTKPEILGHFTTLLDSAPPETADGNER